MGYESSAGVYDAIYTEGNHRKNYHMEASMVHRIVGEAMGMPTNQLRLLDMACGTGLHLEFLAPWFGHVVGVDLSAAQLGIARKRLPDVQFHLGDMRRFHIGSTFDVVTCLFSAIGHLTSLDSLQAAIRNMADQLNPGGIVLVEPWVAPGTWDENRIGSDFVDWNGLKVARFSRGSVIGNVVHLQMHHLVATLDGFDTFTEVHELAMWSQEEFFNAFAAAGLEPTFRPEGLSDNGRGLYVAYKR